MIIAEMYLIHWKKLKDFIMNVFMYTVAGRSEIEAAE